MTDRAIISRGEALQILKNDLRKRALKEHAEELNNSTTEKRAELMQKIEREIEKEIQLRAAKIEPTLLH